MNWIRFVGQGVPLSRVATEWWIARSRVNVEELGLAHPDTATWMRKALSQTLGGDPEAVAGQVDLLKHLVGQRGTAWLPTA